MANYESEKYGYCPHMSQSRIVCPRCGGKIFYSPAQSVKEDAPVWCWEYVCTECKYIIGIETRKGIE